MDADAKSKARHYLQVLLKQPGITKSMTLEQIGEILDNAENANKIDKQLEQPFYNQEKLSFQRLNKKGHTVLMTCKPAAIKLYLVLANYKNQSNVICVSRPDLAKISEMSRPTINSASDELIYKGLMIIERGNEGQGEAITYILNPEAVASGKIIYQRNLVYHYWEKAGQEAKNRFEFILKQQESRFSAEFQVEDTTIRGEVEPQAKIIKKGKEINQNRKRVNAGNIDPLQDTTSPTTHNYYKQDESKNSTPFTDNMQKSSYLLTESEEKMFSGTLRGNFENDPEIPFNDAQTNEETEQLAGQMSVEDYPELMPEGDNNGKTSNTKPGNNDRSRI